MFGTIPRLLDQFQSTTSSSVVSSPFGRVHCGSPLPPNPDNVTASTTVFALHVQHISSLQSPPFQAIFGHNLVIALSVLMWLLSPPAHLVVTSASISSQESSYCLTLSLRSLNRYVAFTPCSSLLQIGPDLTLVSNRDSPPSPLP